jgi:AraC-like DNA-binding protein
MAMAKYNITEKKNREAAYRSLVSPQLMDELEEKINNIIIIQKKYKDKDYSAKQLAEDLNTNTRYISAVVNVRFHMNYISYVNKYRIQEAMSLLIDKRYQDLNMEDISDMVGFANRQSFYASFFRINNITPREYRTLHMPPDFKPTRKTKKRKRVARSSQPQTQPQTAEVAQ